MTSIKYDPEAYHLSLEGHAGLDIRGEDIVCSACSILLWTLVVAAQEFNMDLKLDKDSGKADVSCLPDQGNEEKCRYLFNVIASGLEMLAEKYPEHVEMGGSYGNE